MVAITLEAGDPAPDLELQDQDGKTQRLKDYAGKYVVLYFYPRDDTPGCTKEACSFRDFNADLTAEGAVVLGVSKDSIASHGKFRQKYNLNFPLLADTEKMVAMAYGAWGEKKLYGKPMIGMNRSTFLIGPNGKLAKVWKTVKVEGHTEQVLVAISEHKGAKVVH